MTQAPNTPTVQPAASGAGNQPPSPAALPAPAPVAQPPAGGGQGGGGGPRPPRPNQPPHQSQLPAPQAPSLSDEDVRRIAAAVKAGIPPTTSSQSPADKGDKTSVKKEGLTFVDVLKWAALIVVIAVVAKILWNWDLSSSRSVGSTASSQLQLTESLEKIRQEFNEAIEADKDKIMQVGPQAPRAGSPQGNQSAGVEDPLDAGRVHNTRHFKSSGDFPPQVKALLDSGIKAVLVRSTGKVWSKYPGPYGPGEVTAVP